MAVNRLKNIDEIVTQSGTVVDLENIQASGGAGSAGLEGSGIAYSTDGTDEFYDAGNSSEVIALNIDNPQDGEGLFYDAASQTWVNGAVSLGPTATGGVEAEAGGYKYHLFTTSDADGLTMTRQANVEILLIAGGGGGGAGHYGGGGGAGGLINTTLPLPAGNYPVQIGAYGAGAINTGSAGTERNGGDSTFHTFTAIGGGGGGSRESFANDGADGGSGGGSAYPNKPAGTKTTGQGNDGGGGAHQEYGGGGGGAGGSPTDGFMNGADGAHGQNGGVGLDFSDWANATSTGHNGYYAGGGAGGTNSNTVRSGGLGGGGSSSSSNGTVAVAGLSNTGGGGGGGTGSEVWNGPQSSNVAGQNGGSGILIIRYAI